MKIAPYLLFLTGVVALKANAGPIGPSAQMAARLKVHPTSKWLAHYLPDDRYKIAGGVWKYVSTDLDTYYHRADSPLMLRQSADRVIGFASASDAEEAGYEAEPGLTPPPSHYGLTAGGGSATSVNYTLADGQSSITIPAGWKKLLSFRPQGASPNPSIISSFTMDGFTRAGSSTDIVVILSMTTPRSGQVEEFLSNPQQVTNLGGSISNPMIGTGFQFVVGAAKKVTIKGMKGVVFQSRGPKGDPIKVTAVAKGQRVFMIFTSPTFAQSKEYSAMMKSYDPH